MSDGAQDRLPPLSRARATEVVLICLYGHGGSNLVPHTELLRRADQIVDRLIELREDDFPLPEDAAS